MALVFTPPDPFELAVASLKTGHRGISLGFGAALAEAASICIGHFQHLNPAGLRVSSGSTTYQANLTWEEPSSRAVRSWNDLEVATEHGAYGLAALLIEMYGLEVMTRSRKGTGFDFWLGKRGEQPELFQNLARLEVSGILSGNESEIQSRSRIKITQTKRSDSTSLPAIIAIIEFSNPAASLTDRCNP